jgi:hypothetical protein
MYSDSLNHGTATVSGHNSQVHTSQHVYSPLSSSQLAAMRSATMPRGFAAPRAPCRSLQTLRCIKATGGADRRDVLLGLGGAAAAGLLNNALLNLLHFEFSQ